VEEVEGAEGARNLMTAAKKIEKQLIHYEGFNAKSKLFFGIVENVCEYLSVDFLGLLRLVKQHGSRSIPIEGQGEFKVEVIYMPTPPHYHLQAINNTGTKVSWKIRRRK
jgi:hypothetical protein